MALVIQDGFPGQGAATNLLNVDADNHAFIVPRPAAFGSRGIYRAAVTTPNIGPQSAGATLFLLGPTLQSNPSRLVVVNSVKIAGVVTSAVTTAAPIDFGLFFYRNGALIPTGGGSATVFSPPSNVQGQQLRSSMGGSTSTVAIVGQLANASGNVDTNPIGRVQGFCGTAVGSQFFLPRMATLYQRDNEGHYPIVLQKTGSIQGDKIGIQNILAGPATGLFTMTVIVEWEELVAF